MSRTPLHRQAIAMVDQDCPGHGCIGVSREVVDGQDSIVVAASGPGAARLLEIVRNATVVGIIGGGKHTFSDHYLFELARSHA